MVTCRRKELYKQVRAVIKVFLHISVHIRTHQAQRCLSSQTERPRKGNSQGPPDCVIYPAWDSGYQFLRQSPRSLKSARHLFTSVVQANPELYRWEGARAISLPGSEQGTTLPTRLQTGNPGGWRPGIMTGAGCSRALYSSCMPEQSVCLSACLPHVPALFPGLESWEEQSPYQDSLG